MAQESSYSWKDIALIVGISGISLFILIYDGSPTWLQAIVLLLATIGPVLPILVLIPWHFIAKHRGLIARSNVPCTVSCSNGELLVLRGEKRTSHPLEGIARGRIARNDNWTESKMLEDALGLFTAKGREVVRLPESADGFANVVEELHRRNVPIDYVDVSAPAVLD